MAYVRCAMGKSRKRKHGVRPRSGSRTYYFDTKGCKKQFDENPGEIYREIGGWKMAKATLGGQEIEVDEDGFIQEPGKWNKEVAEDLAKTEDAYPMGEEAWRLVNYLRDYYIKFEIAPPVRMLTKQTKLDLKRIYELFPGGPAKGALQDCRPPETDRLRIGFFERKAQTAAKRATRAVP